MTDSAVARDRECGFGQVVKGVRMFVRVFVDISNGIFVDIVVSVVLSLALCYFLVFVVLVVHRRERGLPVCVAVRLGLWNSRNLFDACAVPVRGRKRADKLFAQSEELLRDRTASPITEGCFLRASRAHGEHTSVGAVSEELAPRVALTWGHGVDGEIGAQGMLKGLTLDGRRGIVSLLLANDVEDIGALHLVDGLGGGKDLDVTHGS